MYHKSESLYFFSFVVYFSLYPPKFTANTENGNVRNILIKKGNRIFLSRCEVARDGEDRRTSSANFYGLAKQREGNCRTDRRCAREKYDGGEEKNRAGKRGGTKN